MQEFFPFNEFKKAGIFTKEMKNDYKAQSEIIRKFFGYKTIYEYGAKEIRYHVSYVNPKDKPFITVVPSIYE